MKRKLGSVLICLIFWGCASYKPFVYQSDWKGIIENPETILSKYQYVSDWKGDSKEVYDDSGNRYFDTIQFLSSLFRYDGYYLKKIGATSGKIIYSVKSEMTIVNYHEIKKVLITDLDKHKKYRDSIRTGDFVIVFCTNDFENKFSNHCVVIKKERFPEYYAAMKHVFPNAEFIDFDPPSFDSGPIQILN